jgi:hypothetical protein
VACAVASALASAPAAADIKDIQLRGLLDVVGAPNNTAVGLNQMNYGSTNFDAYTLRLFAEGKPADHLELYSEIWANDVGLWVYGAYGLYTPKLDKDLHLQAGKIPWPIGTWAPRTYSNKNPLVGVPLIYQYHTSLLPDEITNNPDALLSQAGQGNFEGGPFGDKGMPIVYDRWWDVGLVALGSIRPVEFSLGVTNGTPGSSQAGRDNNLGKSFMGRFGLAPTPGLRFGVSGSIGPYLPTSPGGDPLPAGAKATDFDQRLLMADIEYLVGHAELRAEGTVNTWETPFLGDLTVHGYYVEGKYSFPVGLYLAARWDQLLFSDIQGSTGPPRPWDDNVSRFEGGAGYRVLHPLTAKLVYQMDKLDPQVPAGQSRSYDLMAAALSFSF